jgi:hypothetical protein
MAEHTGFVGGLIAIFVAIVVAVALFPSITSNVNSLTSGATPALTGASATLVGQVPLFLALALMLVAIGFGLKYVTKIRIYIRTHNGYTTKTYTITSV